MLARLSARWGAPDVVFGGTYAADIFKERLVGKTHVLPQTLQAKHLGVLDIVLEPGKDPQMHFSEGALGDAVKEDPAARKAMDVYIAEEKERVNAMNKAVNDNMSNHSLMPTAPQSQPQQQPVPQPQPAQGSTGTLLSGVYYDSTSCQSCHKSEYDSWQTSKHAAAVTTLINKGSDIPSCLECHSERYRQTSAYLPTSDTPKQGVECASCHIRVLPHGAEGVRKNFEGPKIDLDNCRVCHTKDQSPDFESKSKIYWQKVSHKPVKPT
jgi:hypothetical protein